MESLILMVMILLQATGWGLGGGCLSEALQKHLARLCRRACAARGLRPAVSEGSRLRRAAPHAGESPEAQKRDEEA